ncbi:DUF4340 domain-containing protein [Pontiella sp.]|uniref:DUF4340 domain-containing protein n=1 Tax=Pontiella sp. TaxID=2837462 RepID=UPI0035692601
MNKKKLIGMAVALVVLVSLAVVQNQGGKNRRTVADAGITTLFRGLELNRIDGVDISSDGNCAELAKKDGQWVVASLYSYPADFKKLADALQDAAAVEVGAPVRASNVDEAEYGLDDAKSIVLKSGGQPVLSLEVGARREASSGWANQHFIRKDGAADIYLVDYDFRPFAEEPEDWMDTELIHVSSSDIVSVNVGDVELQAVSNNWILADLEEDTEELQSTEANKLRSALQYLNCTTVADPALSDPELGFTNAVIYTASTTNKTYTVSVGGEAEEGRYVRLSGDVPAALQDWTYVVRNYDADDFLITRDQLVKEKEPAETEDEEESE